MSWSTGNNHSWPFHRWEDHPFWGHGPAAGQGVDRAPGGPFTPGGGFPGNPQEAWGYFLQHGGPFGGRRWGGGPWGRPGCHGPHRSRCGRAPPERDDAAEGPSRSAPQEAGVAGDPDISTPDQLNDEQPSSPGTAVPDFHHPPPPFPFPPGPPHGRGHPRRGGPHHGPGDFSLPHRGRGGGRGGGRHRSPGRRGPPPPYPEGPTNPWAQTFHSFAEAIFPNAAGAPPADTSDGTPAPFTPPLDLFATPEAYILHLALPGAKKSDIGVDWDPDCSTLRVAGVIHRPGDEALLASLLPTTAERRVGYFERLIKLPPPETAEQSRRWRDRRPRPQEDGENDNDLMDFEEEGREEIDAASITARMEDGILIVTVPKVEKGWTEVKKVDIE